VSRSPRLLRLIAHAVWATRIVDRVYGRFDRLRTKAVLKWAPDAFYDAYNDVAYSGQDEYHPRTQAFHAELFPWELRAIERHFPPPPASVLIGGAGGGREAVALARRGYQIVAFDPAVRLAAALARNGERDVEGLIGSYDDLPVLSALVPPSAVDLAERAPFDAALFGWASFSHLRSAAGCVAALRKMAARTGGPILVSYFPTQPERGAPTDGRDSFALRVGYFRELTADGMRDLAGAAGLDIVHLEHDAGWPYGVLRRLRSTGGEGPRSTGGEEPRSTGGERLRSTGGERLRSTGGERLRSTGGEELRSTGGEKLRSTGGEKPGSTFGFT
jgi:hypothetical protein